MKNKRIIIVAGILLLIFVGYQLISNKIKQNREWLVFQEERLQQKKIKEMKDQTEKIIEEAKKSGLYIKDHYKTATTTIEVNGYQIESIRLVSNDQYETPFSSKINILKDGEYLFNSEDQERCYAFNRNDGETSLIDNTDSLKRAVRDITGNSIPELLIFGWSGGAHCCYQNYIVELSNPLNILFDLDTGDNAISFEDLNGDGVMEIKTNEDIFAYWNVSYVGSPMPSVILSLKDGKYRADPTFMKNPKPTDTEIQKAADEVISWSGDGSNGYPTVAWKYALDLIYSGNINSAKIYVDLAWKNDSPGEFKTKEGFWNELNEQIKESIYYTDLEDYFNL